VGEHGRSLAELLVVLAIIGIMAGAAMPSMLPLIERARAAKAINTLMGAVQFTRQSAVMFGAPVTLCASSDGVSCGRNWQEGAIAFIDLGRAGRVDREDRVLRRFGPFAKGVSIRWRSFGNRPYLQITPRGFTHHQPGHFQYCPPSADPRLARQIIVNWQGRARMARDRDGDGIRENARGKPLEC
jgi:type IV fimbrial biogenesis protein FimT